MSVVQGLKLDCVVANIFLNTELTVRPGGGGVKGGFEQNP